MKLLFDQNISFRVLKKIEADFIDSAQVRRLGLESESDIDIWKYAKASGFTIVTFDADFVELANIYGHPPKIIWLRIGNNTTNFIADKLISVKAQIKDFISSPHYKNVSCLKIM